VIAEPLNRLTPDKALTFQLARPFALKVSAVEEGSGKPIANARVSLIYDDPSVDKNFSWGYHDTAWGDSTHARTDGQGVATFTPLSFSEGTILVQAPGYARQHVGWRDASDKLTFELKAEAVVSGELIDGTTGKPLESANIHLLSPGGGQVTGLVSPGDGGRFRIGELTEGKYGFSITTNSGTTLHQEQLTLKPGQHESRTLRVSAAGAAIGRILQGLAGPRAKVPEKLFKVGDVAPAFSAKTLDDKPLALKDYRGKYVLLDFWATWCGPCVEELPRLRAVHEAFGKDPRLVMISLSLDASKDDVTSFLKKNKQPWTQVFLGEWSADPVTKDYGVALIPSILLLDPEGKIVAQDLRGDEIKNAVAKALKRD
jgi:thiol-disulfide isomerase/thioredoxin